MAPDIHFSEFHQRPQEEPPFEELLTGQREELPEVETEAIAFIEEAEIRAKEVLPPQYHDHFQLTGVLIDRTNGNPHDKAINCMPIGNIFNHTLSPVASIVTGVLGCAIVDFGEYNDPQGVRLRCTPQFMYTNYFSKRNPTKFDYVAPRTREDLESFIFEEKIPYFAGYLLTAKTLTELKALITEGDPKAAIELIARLRGGLTHAFTLPQ